jgi:arginyl-tRNA synthetase
MPSVQRLLDERVAAAMRAAFPEAADLPAIVVLAQDPRFGDYQANGAMALAKRLKRKPREVAEAVLARLDVSDLAERPEIAGPGFINIRLRPEWVAQEIGKVNRIEPGPAGVSESAGEGGMPTPPLRGHVPGEGDSMPSERRAGHATRVDESSAEDRLGIPRAEKPETVVVDYSAPNLAKEMHVGHLRSTIIGDALVRMIDFVGHNAIRQNHVGDWGTQFGMLTSYMDVEGASPRISYLPEGYFPPGYFPQGFFPELVDLEAFYQKAKTRFDSDPDFAVKSRLYVVNLQSGEARVRQLWQKFRDLSLTHCKAVYKRLGVLLTDADIRGESAYNDDLPKVVEDLGAKGLLTESEGAQCIFLNDADGKPLFVAKDGSPLPLIVQKSDEGFLYATTDLAAIRYRVGELHANRIL